MYRVLVADDESLARERMCGYLKKIPGVSVAEPMRNGAQVKEYLEQHTADAVITDIRMPLMDGLELAGYLHEHRPECHVVLVSAYDEFEYARRAIRFGVESYLVKPIRLQDVQEMIAQLLASRHKEEASKLYVRDLQQETRERPIADWFSGKNETLQQEFLVSAAMMVSFEAADIGTTDRNLLQIGLNNLLHWSASCCTVAPLGCKNTAFRFVLLANQPDFLPEPENIEERLHRLMPELHVQADCQRFDTPDAVREALSSAADCSQEDEVIQKIKAYISVHLAEPINRMEIAQLVYLDPSYLSRYFKKKTGMTFQDYLQNARMERVKQLLKAGGSVKYICEQTGFHDRKYFNELFKEYTGVSPSEYRRQETGTEDSSDG